MASIILQEDNGVESNPELLWGSVLGVSASRYQVFGPDGDSRVKGDGRPQGDAVVNLITNPSLEINATGYAGQYHVASLVRSGAQALRGADSLLVTVATGGDVYCGYSVPATVVSGRTYSALVAILASTSGNYALNLSDTGNTSWGALGPTVAITANQWTWLKVDGVPCNLNAAAVRFQIQRSGSNWANGETFYTDAHMLSEATVGEYVEGYEIGASWDGAAHASTSRRTARVNLVSNPSFEVAALSPQWAGYATGTQVLSSAWSAQGSKSVRVSGTQPIAGYCGSGIYNGDPNTLWWRCTGGVMYTGRCVVRVDDAWEGTDSHQPVMFLRFVDASGAQVGQVASSPAASSGVSTLTVSGTAPVNAAYMYAFIICESSAAPTSFTFDWSVDAVQVVAEPSPSNYFDGDTGGCTWSGDRHASPPLMTNGVSLYRRITVQDGDSFLGAERAELGDNTLNGGQNGTSTLNTGTFAIFREGEVRSIYFSLRLPSTFPLSTTLFQVVNQLRCTAPSSIGSGSPSPVLQINARDGRWRVYHLNVSDGSTAVTEVWSAPAQLNVWTRFRWDITFSKDPAKGRYQLTVDDGTVSQSPTFKDFTLCTEISPGAGGFAIGDSVPSHLRTGIYHDPAVAGTSVDVDNVQVIGDPDPGRANCCSNPSFENDTFRWATFSSSGDWAVTTAFGSNPGWAYRGSKSGYIKLTKAATVTASTYVIHQAPTNPGRNLAAAAPGQSWIGHAIVNVLDPATTGIRIRVGFYDATGTSISFINGGQVTTAGISRTAIGPGVAPAGTAYVGLRFEVQSSTSGDVFEGYIDACMLSQSTEHQPYGDGDTPGWMWVDSPHRSESKQVTANTSPLVIPGRQKDAYGDYVRRLEPSVNWRHSEGFGGRALDSSDNTSHATYYGGYTLGATGAILGSDGTAIDLGGVDGYIDSSFPPFKNGEAQTFLGWASLDSLAANAVLLASDNDTTTARLRVNAATTNVNWRADGNVAVDATWTGAWVGLLRYVFWAFIFDEQVNRAELFIDGLSLGAITHSTAYNASVGNLRIGRQGATGASYLDGRTHEFAAFARALSPDEIAAVYRLGRYGVTP